MDKSAIVALIALLTALAGLGYHFSQGELDISRELTKFKAWEQWQLKYGKQYKFQEVPLKFAQFCKAYDFVEKHNAEKHKYTVTLNSFADLSQDEFASYRMSMGMTEDMKSTKTFDQVELASSINWHTKGAVGPVYNQGQCGSCWAFSAVEAIEGLYELEKSKYDDFSVQQVVDCSQYTGAQGCNGGYPQWAYEYIMKYGIELESSYPYTAATGTCKYDKSDVVFKIGGYVNVTIDSPDQMKIAIQKRPLSICIEADSYAFQLYQSGIFDDASCGTKLDHCVLLDGYNVQGSTDYWIVENSWGSSWGNNGYIWIEQSTGKGICGINTWVTYPTA